MTTDFRALCAELLEALEIQLDELASTNRLCKRARAALSEPVVGAAAPSDEEVYAEMEEFSEFFDSSDGFGCIAVPREKWVPAGRALLARFGSAGLDRCNRLQQEQRRFREPERTILCDILANGTLLPDPQGTRYGTTTTPVAVAKRLPGDYDAEGRLWVFDDMLGLPSWTLIKVQGNEDMPSLPAHALPLPAAPGEGKL